MKQEKKKCTVLWSVLGPNAMGRSETLVVHETYSMLNNKAPNDVGKLSYLRIHSYYNYLVVLNDLLSFCKISKRKSSVISLLKESLTNW